jgi:pseudaminic acid biosynthesis-associated methylase
MITDQMQAWMGEFGREYTDRNTFSLEEMEALYAKTYGLIRTDLNRRCLEGIDRSSRILEVGSNIGIQLALLQNMGFTNLYGIELQSYAVELSKSKTHNINIIQGSAFDIPFKDEYFDLVFTSGVLIHIHPSNISEVMNEIYRCTKKYIWGLEHYSDNYKEVVYRGQKNLLWNVDYKKLYLDLFDDLESVKDEQLKYLDSDNVDSMFLLRKKPKVI